MSNTLPAYLLLGPEIGEKHSFIEKLRQGFTVKGEEKPEEQKFFAFETGMNDLVSLLRNGSLFTSRRIIHLLGVDTITKKGEIAVLNSYLKNPMENTLLLLQSDTTKADPGLKKLFPGEGTRIFWELYEDQKRGWIVRYFREAKLTISEEAVDVLLEMVENNTRDLKNECEKFALFFEPGKKISGEELEQYIYHSKEENVFTLFEKIAGRDLGASQEILYKILLSREAMPTQLLAGLNWQFKQLLAYKTLLEQQYNAAEAFSKLRIMWKKNQKIYSLGAQKYSLMELRHIISHIVQYDTWLRSDKGDVHSLLLSMFLYKCII